MALQGGCCTFIGHRKKENEILGFGPRWQSARERDAGWEEFFCKPLVMEGYQPAQEKFPASRIRVQAYVAAKGAARVLRSRPGDELLTLCNEGQLERAVEALFSMDRQGTVPSVEMYRSLLKACTKRKALPQAKRVHAHLAKLGLETTHFLGESVVKTLVKCGSLKDALQVFHRLPNRTVVSWTAVIAGYADNGQGSEALAMYQPMQEDGVQPNAYTFVSLLRACSSMADLAEGKRIHAEVLKYNCGNDLFVRTCLVDMYGKCGSIADAQHVFDGLSQRDVVSWNSMLSAYVEQGQAERALELYGEMLEKGVSPDERTFVSTTQACGMLADKDKDGVDVESLKGKCLTRGREIHENARRKGYDSDVFVAATLVRMYGKCGSIQLAENVFNGLSQRNLVTWTVMLTAYVQQGQAAKALQLYERMHKECVSPDNHAIVIALNACCMVAEKEENAIKDGLVMKVQCLEIGTAIHADARRKGCDSDPFVGNSLISMYGKCGSIMDAQNVFDRLSPCDVGSCNMMIAAYMEQGQAVAAIQIYQQLQNEGMRFDSRTFVSVLQACGMLADMEVDVVVDGRSTKVKSLEQVKAIHVHAQAQCYESDVFVGSALITQYGKCGSIVHAQNVFDGLAQRDVVAWTAMLAAYVEQHQAENALQLYLQMCDGGVTPNERTFVSALQACGMLFEVEVDVAMSGCSQVGKSLELGKTIHADAWSKGYQGDEFVSNTLISMYGRCGSIANGRNIFDELPERSVVSWNVMLRAYVEQGLAGQAIELYEQMSEEGVTINERTCVSVLQACTLFAEEEEAAMVHESCIKVKCLKMARVLHANVHIKGYNADTFVANTLVSLYRDCGCLIDAQNVLDGLLSWDVVSWNVLIGAFVEQAQAEVALDLYGRMMEECTIPNERTFMMALQACGMLAEEEEEVLVHGRFTKVKCLQMGKAMLGHFHTTGCNLDIFVGSVLVSLYAKCGSIVDARSVFDRLSEHDVVTWNTMLAAYVDLGQPGKALQLYRQMQQEGPRSDDITVSCILQACGNTGSLDTLRQMHPNLTSTGGHLSPILANTLIAAYGKCSSMVDAQAVFEALHHADVMSWSSLMAGYARQGDSEACIQCYERMNLAGVHPTGVTFLSLLSACSYSGLVDKGVDYFVSMSRDHSIAPEIEHYVSLVDLLGRAGCFSRILDMLATMPMQPNLSIWLCLLGACRKHKKVILGEQVFNCAVGLHPKHPAAYVVMSNIYADAGLFDRAKEVNALEQNAAACDKPPGQSWIEQDQEVHMFMVEDQKHPQRKELYDFLGRLGS